MCGICGKFNTGTGEPVQPELIKRMTDVLRHRGPDGEGCYINGNIGLGHRRLKIIDLETGQQPMFNEDGSLGVVFNGEIYNFVELRRELQAAGHQFRTKSDTEVLLHGYEQWGSGLLQRLRGMFAFALWDRRNRELFLARDRLGIKPLYYYWDGKTLLFASEIKAILQDAEVTRAVEPAALDDFLTYMYIPAPKTIFKNIYKLRAGHCLKASAAGIQTQEYWDIDFAPNGSGNENEYAGGLLEQLKESVRLHLVSEVPLGAFLSGGIDSSAVVGLMNEVVGSPINTASIGFRESAFDELPYARMVANRFNTNAHERVVDAQAAEILETLAWHFDEPFADDSMVPTYYVSQVAREKVTVCLSGDGGDENFAGYRRYRFDVLENRLRSLLPSRISSPVFARLAGIYPKADWLPQIFRAKTLLTNLSYSPEQGYFNTMSWLKPKAKRRLYNETFQRELNGYEPIAIMQEHFARTRGWDALSRIQYVDIKTYLVDDILTKVDRTSMAHALEVRVPILDHQVMEYAAHIPAGYKLRGREEKYIFKKALQAIVPPQIIHRPKRGFSVPLAAWLRKDLKNVFEERVFSPYAWLNNWFEPKALERLWSQHQRGTRDYAHELWALLVLEHWCGKFLAS
jgi:asparagine synthase (glutamine-hydrolysing)